MASAILFNGIDPAALGFKVSQVRGFGNLLGSRLPTVRVPGRAGAFALSPRASEVAPREISVVMTLRPRLASGSLAAMEAALVELAALVGGGLIELRDGRDAAKKVFGQLAGGTEDPFDPQYLAADPASRFTLRFLCLDPYRYAGITVQAFGTVATAIRLGNVPSDGEVWILGAVTNPVLTYRTAGGILLQTLGFTIALGANDYLRILTGDGTILKSVAGVVTDAYAIWTTKSDGMLVLDPHDGDPTMGAGPLLALSGGTGEVHLPPAFA